jgi:DegV family protein with EDD domain
MMKIGIITDSTADLPLELAAEYGIEVVPVQVAIGDRHFRDGVDITPDQLYQEMITGPDHPTTSQPAPGVFAEYYRKMLQTKDAILSIHLTGKLSGTVRSAEIAREVFPDAAIHVIDSNSLTMGLGGLVLETARAVKRGLNLEELLDFVRKLREKTSMFVFFDTLEYIRRGGRINRIHAFIGSVLHIKPLLQLKEGELHLTGRTRSRREAVALLIEEFKKEVNNKALALIAVIYTTTRNDALELKKTIELIFNNVEIIVQQAGPALGTHAGPGAMALVAIGKE